jgi:hypothetical protein
MVKAQGTRVHTIRIIRLTAVMGAVWSVKVTKQKPDDTWNSLSYEQLKGMTTLDVSVSIRRDVMSGNMVCNGVDAISAHLTTQPCRIQP